jgi:tRNA(Ile)-lysidine synthase
VSGGSDSLALGHLIARYGRRITGAGGKVRWLHVNHGWRGQESDTDATHVAKVAHELGVPCRVVNLSTPVPKGESWEKFAREQRNQALAQEAARTGSVIFTAHHADDLAETVLWRLMTGAASTQGGGILLKYGSTYRPFLKARKEQLKQYLKEEGIPWREDRTNHEARFLRSRMRVELMPVLLNIFPRAVEHLCELGLLTQKNSQPALKLKGRDFHARPSGIKLTRWNDKRTDP